MFCVCTCNCIVFVIAIVCVDWLCAGRVATASTYEPTPLSMQVRKMRVGGDAHKPLQQNMLLAFDNVVPRLDTVYAARAADAPPGFEERINFWHRECGMPATLKDKLHKLRIWANAGRHHDNERWLREGPRNEAEALRLVSEVEAALGGLESKAA